MEQEYIITVFSENKVGLLSQITTVFTCRDVNIESLTTSESALQGIHKFTIVVRTTPDQVDKLVRQVEKKIDVLKTFVYTPDEVVQQEIALYKVTRSRGVEQLVREHNVRILEIDEDYIVVEKTGHKADTQALFRLLQPYGVQQFVRSGTVAIIKSRRELLNELRSKMHQLNGNELNRVQMKVYDLDDETEFREFAKGAQRPLKVYGTDRYVAYDPQKRIGVTISKLGASQAISVGAYAFALSQLDTENA